MLSRRQSLPRRGLKLRPRLCEPIEERTRAGEETYRIASDIYGHMSRLDTEHRTMKRYSLPERLMPS